MAKTEFHGRDNRDDDKPDIFTPRIVTIVGEQQFAKVVVVLNKVEITGMFGRRLLSTVDTEDFIQSLQDAVDFIEGQ